ncbi:MAG: hypothetical protein ACTSU4_11160 [Promethearchaeota archaeon]
MQGQSYSISFFLLNIHPKPTFSLREYISLPFSSTTVMWAAHDSQQSKQRTTISRTFTTPSGTSSLIFFYLLLIHTFILFNPRVR